MWIRPIVSATAIGSFAPDSASRTRARRRRTSVTRSVENTAAASVDATTAPSRNDVDQVSGKTSCATTAVSAAVIDDARPC